ncbi:hypothetical protein SAMN04488115_1044 [Bosea lathyri]|uniref:Uncharacterized protein n=1 Tax=Bosea lathyri TaxID=1036778 RepID=A0A1H5YNC2_9HYPH|nr:hypothetical protein SAMN04488115_1044 [Bosea lathyri]
MPMRVATVGTRYPVIAARVGPAARIKRMNSAIGTAVQAMPSASIAGQWFASGANAATPETASVNPNATSPETTCWPSASRAGSPADAGTART